MAATKANPEGLPSTHDYPETLRLYVGPSTNYQHLFGYDYGVTPGATGAVKLDADGHPVSYRAAPDDRWAQVADRFGLPQLWGLNCVRRLSSEVYAGDIINLSPYTVASVGDENGSTTRASAEAQKDCLAQTGLPKQTALGNHSN